jgi:hypothetical protein
MAYSDVSICNLALTHLGDKAAVVSISAPTTAQETYCATYYPIARDLTMEGHSWSFNTVRKALVVSSVTPPSTWQYCYDAPANILRLLELLDPNADDDYATSAVFIQVNGTTAPIPSLSVPTPYPFAQEWDEANSKSLIYSNLASAIARYTITVTDPTKWSNDFVMALSYRLAAMLAGPIIKGDVGTKVVANMSAEAERWLARAKGSDSNERLIAPVSAAPWMIGRG